MKKFIKKSAAIALSIFGILLAMPSALCTPSEEDDNPASSNNGRGHIDSFHAMIIGKYFNSVQDFNNLSLVNKKYKNILERYKLNPVEIDSKKQLSKLRGIETYRVGENEGDIVYVFPSKNIKTLIFLAGSFSIDDFIKVLKDNGIFNDNFKISKKWKYETEINDGNIANGCRVTFKSGDKKIVFLFDPRNIGKLRKLGYNFILERCGLGPNVMPLQNDLNILNSATRIDNNAFVYDITLKNVSIPNSVTDIGSGAFQWCTCLGEVYIPNSVTSIGNQAFAWCLSLREISIPNSVKNLGNYVFYACPMLEHIYFNGNVYNDVKSFLKAFEDYRGVYRLFTSHHSCGIL